MSSELTRRSHPSLQRLESFATGATPAAPAIAVSAHLETCESCRRQVEQLEEAEGRRLASLPPAPLSSGLLDHLLARIDALPKLEPVEPRWFLDKTPLPAAVARAGLGSRRWLAPGLWAAPVRARPTDGWRLFLLRAPAGTEIPSHGHGGGEMIAVLSGAVRNGARLEAGDFSETIEGPDHRLRVARDGPCVCLVAIQGRVRWRGWARLIMPLLGI